MDIVKRLRAGFMGEHVLTEAADEIERLRDALKKIKSITSNDWVEDMDKHDTDINEIIKKALGGK